MSFSKVWEQGRESLKVGKDSVRGGRRLPASEFSPAPPCSLSLNTNVVEDYTWFLVGASGVGREGKGECESRAGPRVLVTVPKP